MLGHARDIPFEDISVGMAEQFDVVVDERAVEGFARLTGDVNPLHMDDAYAGQTQFGGRIAHGMLCASYFSALVGMLLPGKRCLYLSQEAVFRKPVRIGERLTIRGEVIKTVPSLRMLELHTEAIGEDGSVRVDGHARVRILP
jgi:3-hydroxybutyryl-CoA dehydratase